jgi:hypothetical protein
MSPKSACTAVRELLASRSLSVLFQPIPLKNSVLAARWRNH